MYLKVSFGVVKNTLEIIWALISIKNVKAALINQVVNFWIISSDSKLFPSQANQFLEFEQNGKTIRHENLRQETANSSNEDKRNLRCPRALINFE